MCFWLFVVLFCRVNALEREEIRITEKKLAKKTRRLRLEVKLGNRAILGFKTALFIYMYCSNNTHFILFPLLIQLVNFANLNFANLNFVNLSFIKRKLCKP